MLPRPERSTIGAAAVFGAPGDTADDRLASLCDALASEGIAALRFVYREPATFETALADVAGAIRLLKAHPLVPERLAVVGHELGGAVAAFAAGRDSRIVAAVVVDAPGQVSDAGWRPIAELSRTRSRVLLIGGDAERYAAVLMQARVRNQQLDPDEVDRAAKIATWLHSVLA
ncbi:MAG: hypothetical protein NVSMB8_13040 [Candidatus Limnocylindrales bacterium]